MGKALYRKYRSRSLSEIVGQSHVTDILARAIKNDKIAHAYLFTGPKGVGKTSIARILAHEINDLPYTDESNHLDIIEIDAASNNGVDDIRELREKVLLAPSIAKKKVYIIDEVHMLTKQAFNALLKTLEEPPEHVVFILATTDVDKLPDTIISRTQRHSFRRASIENIVTNLRSIATKESISISDDALQLIARHSDGSYRDSVSLLDQLSSVVENGKEISSNDIEQSLGLAAQQTVDMIIHSVESHSLDTLVNELKQAENHGIQASILASQIIDTLTTDPKKYTNLLELIDKLITVKQSALPEATLLAALGTYIYSHTPAKAIVAAPPKKEVILELSTKAEEPVPKDDLVKQTTPVEPPKVVPDILHDGSFEWNDVIAATKDESIGLHTVLKKCTCAASGDKLTIYCKTEFYKKKLDMPKYLQALQTVLQQLTHREWDIETIPSTQPSKNSQVAAVAAIMGGGEEVSVDETLLQN